MDSHDFQLQVIESLSELKTETKNIVARLDKLNGSVARHEEAIGELKVQMAGRENSCPLVTKVQAEVDALSSAVAAKDAEKKALHPIVYGVVSFCFTAICFLILTHSQEFLKFIGK